MFYKKIVLLLFFSYIFYWWYMYKLIAHRALDNHKYKENSIEAFINCLDKDYIDGVEIDVRITKDKKLILNHNSIIGNNLIKNQTLKQLKKYNVTLLEDVLKLNTNKIIVLDLKDKMKSEIKKIIKKYNYLNLYICSFNYELVSDLLNTNVKIGLIVGYFINKNKNYSKFDFLNVNYKEKVKFNKEIMLWTINKYEDLKKINIKDFYLITDCAYKFIKS